VETTKPTSNAAHQRPVRASSVTSTLDQQLERLEQKWFAILQAEFPDRPLPTSASGEIQFFSTDFPRTYVAPRDGSDLPDASGSAFCVVCVGINHNTYRGRAEGNKIAPHIYTRSRGQMWTVDLARTRATRRALNTALAAYAINRQAWTDNGYASRHTLLPKTSDSREADFPLVIIKTHLSPFVFTKPWSEYSGTVRRETLDAWNPNRHMCDLVQTLGNNIDLWVIHGNYVWPHFITTSHEITNWMVTPTLTYESQRNGTIATFWRTKRIEESVTRPRFPSC